MEKFYDILDKEDGLSAVALYIERIVSLRRANVKDPIGKIKAEILYETPIWVAGEPDKAFEVIKLYNSLNVEDQRKVDMTIRDLIDHYKVENIIENDRLSCVATGDTICLEETIRKVIGDYIEFRTTLDTVSPESSEEIEKILEMSDEEYEAYQEAQDTALENQLEEAYNSNSESE